MAGTNASSVSDPVPVSGPRDFELSAGMGLAGRSSRSIKHDITDLLRHPGSLRALRRARRLIDADRGEGLLPKGLYRFVLAASPVHQAALAALTTLVFLISAAPIEMQRRIVNGALKQGSFERIAILAISYVGLELCQGVLKMAMNVYRGWVGENSVRYLRCKVLGLGAKPGSRSCGSHDDGVDIAIVVAEADPIGEFVGVAFSEPLLQCGILVVLLGYMAYLQPLMAGVCVAALAPQILFVPPMQGMINRRASARVLTLRSIGSAISRHLGLGAGRRRQRGRVQHVFNLNMGIYRIKYLMNFMMNFSYHLANYVATGRIEVGTVLAFAAGLTRINDPWGDLVNWYRQLRVTQAKYALIQAAPALKLAAG
jgi:hypothetical protein